MKSAKAHEWGKHAEEQGYLSKLIGKYGSHGVLRLVPIQVLLPAKRMAQAL